MNVTLEKPQKTKVYIPNCWICMDKGFVLYRDANHYEYIAHCTCVNGYQWAYDGRKCTKNPSPFYAPSVAEKFDVEKLAADNFWNWWNIYRDKPGIKEELERRGIPTEKLDLGKGES